MLHPYSTADDLSFSRVKNELRSTSPKCPRHPVQLWTGTVRHEIARVGTLEPAIKCRRARSDNPLVQFVQLVLEDVHLVLMYAVEPVEPDAVEGKR